MGFISRSNTLQNADLGNNNIIVGNTSSLSAEQSTNIVNSDICLKMI